LQETTCSAPFPAPGNKSTANYQWGFFNIISSSKLFIFLAQLANNEIISLFAKGVLPNER